VRFYMKKNVFDCALQPTKQVFKRTIQQTLGITAKRSLQLRACAQAKRKFTFFGSNQRGNTKVEEG
jgi:hypothetical protein